MINKEKCESCKKIVWISNKVEREDRPEKKYLCSRKKCKEARKR